MKIRILLISLLVGTTPLAAQRPTADVPPLRSGTLVRVFLHDGPFAGSAGVVVSGTPDTLRVASPALGLVLLSAADLQRLEAPGGRRPTWKYPVYVVAPSGALVLLNPLDLAFPVFMNGLIVFGTGAGIAYLLEPPRRTLSLDVGQGLPAVHQNPSRPGVPVRISTATRPLIQDLLRGFSADSVYLFSGGAPTPLARVEIRELQVSMGRDRRRGAQIGGRVGALAGVLVGTGWAVREAGSEWGLVVAPAVALVGAGFGWAVGTPAGWAFAPRRWEDVPLHAPER